MKRNNKVIEREGKRAKLKHISYYEKAMNWTELTGSQKHFFSPTNKNQLVQNFVSCCAWPVMNERNRNIQMCQRVRGEEKVIDTSNRLRTVNVMGKPSDGPRYRHVRFKRRTIYTKRHLCVSWGESLVIEHIFIHVSVIQMTCYCVCVCDSNV